MHTIHSQVSTVLTFDLIIIIIMKYNFRNDAEVSKDIVGYKFNKSYLCIQWHSSSLVFVFIPTNMSKQINI